MTTRATLNRRVQALEMAQRDDAGGPPYIVVASAADIPAALADLPDGWRCPVYVGASPDDWDDD